MNLSGREGLGFILGRRSIRVYSPGQVSEGKVQRLLAAAMAVPSVRRQESVAFRGSEQLGNSFANRKRIAPWSDAG